MPKPTRSTPYLAPGAPKSPLALGVGALVAALFVIVGHFVDAPWLDGLDPDVVAAVILGIFSIFGLGQDRLARREQIRQLEQEPTDQSP